MKISYLVGSQTYANYLYTVSTISVLICSAAHPTSSTSRHAQALQQTLVLLERIIHHVRSSKCASTSVNFDTRAARPSPPRSVPLSAISTHLAVGNTCARRAFAARGHARPRASNSIIRILLHGAPARQGRAGEPERALAGWSGAERDSGGAGERAGNTGQARGRIAR